MSAVITATIKSNYKGLKYTRQQLEEALRILLARRAQKVMEEIRASMLRAKHGKVYSRGGRVWTASAPGEPPAVVTGKLKGSLRKRTSANGLKVRISAEVKYGKWLEKGTSRMAARPFLAPAIKGLDTLTARDAREAIKRGVLNRK